MSRLFRLWPLAVILLLAGLLTPAFSVFVREVVVIPLLYLFWLARFFVAAIPQAGWWVAAILLCGLIMAAALIQPSESDSTGRPTRPETPPARVGEWAVLLNQARQEPYFKWRLGQGFQKLALAMIAYRRGQTLKETRRQLRQGQLDLPPAVQAYFMASLKPLGSLSQGGWGWGRKKTATPLELAPAQVVEFLEQLEQRDESRAKPGR